MSIEELASTVADYGAAAKNAHAAGFDGVELHAATTYLLPKFLNSALNIREDADGGTAENRTRIVLEVGHTNRRLAGQDRLLPRARFNGTLIANSALTAPPPIR